MWNEPIPPRPSFLVPPAASSLNNQDAAGLLLTLGKVTVIGGVSLMGDQGYIVTTFSVIRLLVQPPAPENVSPDDEHRYAPYQHIIGWTISYGHPDNDEPKWEWYDSHTATEMPVPTLMFYFVGECTDDTLVTIEADQEKLKKVDAFLRPFISDDGPPAEIDW